MKPRHMNFLLPFSFFIFPISRPYSLRPPFSFSIFCLDPSSIFPLQLFHCLTNTISKYILCIQPLQLMYYCPYLFFELDEFQNDG
ncbi:hypothetical protein F4805DRAFT_428802 [Annulohypoxylon moriforme]|nr:hypothetical protein F4805DRAFT_428802 [Annulohypoxylon moriforme]